MKVEIRFLRGGRAGQQLVLEDCWPIRLGRGHDNHVVFDVDQDVMVSAYHAEIRSEADGLHLVDLGSINGTFMGGQRIQRVRLADCQQVTFGPDGPQLLVEIHGGPQPAVQQPWPPPVQPTVQQPAVQHLAPPSAPPMQQQPVQQPAPHPPVQQQPMQGASAVPAPRPGGRVGLVLGLTMVAVMVGGGVTLALLRPTFLIRLWDQKEAMEKAQPDEEAGEQAQPGEHAQPDEKAGARPPAADDGKPKVGKARPENQAPMVLSFQAASQTVIAGGSTTLKVGIADPENDPFRVWWDSSCGNVVPRHRNPSSAIFLAPAKPGACQVTVIPEEKKTGRKTSARYQLLVTPYLSGEMEVEQ